jgi:hypothetical protein
MLGVEFSLLWWKLVSTKTHFMNIRLWCFICYRNARMHGRERKNQFSVDFEGSVEVLWDVCLKWQSQYTHILYLFKSGSCTEYWWCWCVWYYSFLELSQRNYSLGVRQTKLLLRGTNNYSFWTDSADYLLMWCVRPVSLFCCAGSGYFFLLLPSWLFLVWCVLLLMWVSNDTELWQVASFIQTSAGKSALPLVACCISTCLPGQQGPFCLLDRDRGSERAFALMESGAGFWLVLSRCWS